MWYRGFCNARILLFFSVCVPDLQNEIMLAPQKTSSFFQPHFLEKEIQWMKKWFAKPPPSWVIAILPFSSKLRLIPSDIACFD